MRIISGKYKKKHITVPKKLAVRPTSDFAKEALFNILLNIGFNDNTNILDLFAGTGNISYEFASRGVKNITAVDINFNCIRFISKISKELSFNIKTIRKDVFNFLNETENKYDIIFADPPYSMSNVIKIPEIIFTKKILKKNGILIIEHYKKISFQDFKNFKFSKKYGITAFSFFVNS